jgi:hypothetical protein
MFAKPLNQVTTVYLLISSPQRGEGDNKITFISST